MSSYATAKSTQQDQRTMAEQAENLAGAGAIIAEPSSIIVGRGGTVGDITFSVQEEEEDGINSQLAEILTASFAQSPITPATPDIPNIPTKSVLGGIGTNTLIMAGIGVAVLFFLVKK